MSLLRSWRLELAGGIYKYSAPPELARLVRSWLCCASTVMSGIRDSPQRRRDRRESAEDFKLRQMDSDQVCGSALSPTDNHGRTSQDDHSTMNGLIADPRGHHATDQHRLTAFRDHVRWTNARQLI